jgi:hypothetical protein
MTDYRAHCLILKHGISNVMVITTCFEYNFIIHLFSNLCEILLIHNTAAFYYFIRFTYQLKINGLNSMSIAFKINTFPLWQQEGWF